MISTSCISGTGFMKCMPITWSGRPVWAASLVIEIELVLEASRARAGATRSSSREDLALDLEALDHRLDHQVGVGERGEPGRRPDAGARGVALAGGQLALGDQPLEALVDRRETLVESRRGDVDQRHREARLRGDLRDAVAHRAGADDAEAADLHARLLPPEPMGRRAEGSSDAGCGTRAGRRSSAGAPATNQGSRRPNLVRSAAPTPTSVAALQAQTPR